MLDEMAAITSSSPISQLVNTHANSDHCYGNELVDTAEISSSKAGAEEMQHTPPEMLAAMMQAAPDMGDLEPTQIDPGHGPITDIAGVIQVRDYLEFVDRETRARHAAGMSAADAAADISLEQFADWIDSERIAVNVDTIYSELDTDRAPTNIADLFAMMARLAV